ncbi:MULTISPECIES: hypothetical protein [Acetobacter]|uniref:Uncharacterized protein n=1 Tax=Acetobacter sacchari TaxID=2661687 RepID=A0ABS3LY91_9PROT|nr:MULTISPECIES: hypothetical protein [Acetobacter]MBO1360882.1 hypothetical protein [Acetobacter sacchari]OUJ15510.1 hypothetical protein HK28_07600 [Acetobacter sp. DsW_063]
MMEHSAYQTPGDTLATRARNSWQVGKMGGVTRSTPERIRRKAAHLFATFAMGAWLLLAVVPFVVVLVEIG